MRSAHRKPYAVTPLEHDGLAALAITSGAAQLVVVHEVGPRIAAFGAAAHPDLLFWDHDHSQARGEWRLRGGHRLWVTRPGADESEESYTPDNVRCVVRKLRDGVRVIAPPDRAGLEKSMTIRVRDDIWTITHGLRNTSDMLWRGGAWALTCTRPDRSTRYRVPLPTVRPGWDVLRMAVPRRWGGGHTSRLDDPQFRFTEESLEIRARGVEAKRMLLAPLGTLEMIDDRRGTFVKTARHQVEAAYPLATNVAVYIAPGNFMVELETMSPFTTLAPRARLEHIETWTYRTSAHAL